MISCVCNKILFLFAMAMFLETFAPPGVVTAFVMTPVAANQRSSSRLFATSPVQAQEAEFWQRSAVQSISEPPEIVYILLYNPGTAEEGVHTTSVQGQAEILWAFADIADCMQFAALLKDEPPPEFNMALYPEAIPTPAPLAQMQTASRDMGLELRIVPPAA